MKKSITIITFLALISWGATAQTVTFNLLQTPCNHNGILEIHTTGLTPPISFMISAGSQYFSHTSNTVNDTLFGYSGCMVGITASSGANSVSNSFAGQPPFTYSINTTPAICPALGTATAVIAGGAPPYTVLWEDPYGTNVIAAGNPANVPGGQYSVWITDANGCAYSSIDDSLNIYVGYQSPINFTVSSTPANCTNGTATATAPTGGIAPYSYLWSNGATSSSISGLSMGQYSLTVTDAQGCYFTQYTYVSQSINITANPVVTPATCLSTNGSIIAFGGGGVPPYSYLWDNGQTTQTISNLSGGQYYTVTVTDANGCISYPSYSYLNITTPITVTYTTTSSLCTAPTGTATLTPAGGTLPYTITWNTFPAQTGITATGLSPGFYYFNVTDAAGCARTGNTYVPPVSVITGTIYKTDALCQQPNGMAGINITAGTPPYTYAWNTLATTASISGLVPGSYNCTITDNMGCSISKQTGVYSSSPISLNFSTTPASCIFANDGIAAVTAIGGTPPYTYNWSNGATAATATGLLTGAYWVTVHDAAGCAQTSNCYVSYNAGNNSCYCTVSGTVYDDVNTNCTLDLGETGIENIMIHLAGIGYTYTDANGNYSFIAPTGNYNLSEIVENYYPLAACQNNSISISAIASSGCVITNNIANVINPLHDISIYHTYLPTPPVPGYPYQQNIIVKNEGTIAESAVQLGYKSDGQLQLTSLSSGLFTQQNALLAPDWYSIINGFPTLTPASTQNFFVQYNVPTNIPIGTSLQYNDTSVYLAPMTNWLTDYTPWNNLVAYYPSVVGSWDPNVKEVSPKGDGEAGFISQNDSVLTYTIHFQNTGNYNAQNIFLIDTLDSDLNLATLHPVYSNHAFTTEVSETGVVKFMFNNINLPYSFPTSVGEIIYTIHLKPNLPDLTQIKNTADIYFDFNAPVRTNATLNTLAHNVGVADYKEEDGISIYPNPSSGKFQVYSSRSKVQSLKVVNLLGEVVYQSQINNLQSTIDLSKEAKGIYFVQLQTEKGTVNRKIVVE